MLGYLWQSTRGYRLAPWRSPYLKWRIETYWGLHAEDLGRPEMLRFLWQHRRELFRFLVWAERMRASVRH
ncbi:MAG: hypothetical protein IT162_10900 [Bryobacterales bacterium]|nr:hypothetical protein [Bryobacterales bacterium]